ncbi:hypothetical protein MHK_010429, partial [Candidatus Magnetomorum sp. HK-1]
IKTAIGKSIDKNISMELNIDYIFGFEADSSTEILPNRFIKLNIDADVQTFIASVKYSFNTNTDIGIKPYVTGGLGLMQSSLEGKVDGVVDGAVIVSEKTSESYSSLCLKFGGGFEYPILDNISFNFEGAYVKGFGDNDGLNFLNVLLGCNYYISL